MERAAKSFTDYFMSIIKKDRSVVVVSGPGNNGGDGLAIARLLKACDYEVEVIYTRANTYSNDFLLQFDKLKRCNVPIFELTELNEEGTKKLMQADIIIDAIFGIGLNRVPQGLYSSVITCINNCNKFVVSVDVPSGIGESTLPSTLHSIKAHVTISFELIKLACVLEENIPFIGQLVTVSIGLSEKAISEQETDYFALELKDARKLLSPKEHYYNKWKNGHAVIVAGTESKAGAALLSAEACLHSGCGMLTAVIPSSIKSSFNVRLPEVMLHTDLHQQIVTNIPVFPFADAYGIGCGIGTSELTQQALMQFILQCNKPVVFDADAINILALHKNYTLPKNCILTPHFKEFDRLTKPHLSHAERLITLKEYCVKNKCTMVLKATHTCICDAEGRLLFCLHPNASLGKAGTGDVLTGIITSLLAQNYDTVTACIIALQLLTLSADKVSNKYTAFCASASLLIEGLPKAFQKILS
jgi:NAD(P)H-hydrate epimerase